MSDTTNTNKWAPWPKEGDQVQHEETGKHGEVLSHVDGIVTVDWGLYVTKVKASELEHIP